ncbi:MAG: hypothetical protein Athens101428_737 [Candidatus Berkelbacteria bacterium Athens1014_28]|uniref:Uncharacterized protein n=1 Tax=Candidatus Berkelbacteria bacterium Athens1014_28 TaxID=2017145 RepID=A0A554LJS0_9BACT|nr:MAG: hypothetical protein Athens101428_737 [Candidatus Berkelbacteria bacterium Athens1014_28]
MNEEIPTESKRVFPVWLIIIIVLVLVGALTALGWWLYKNQSKNENSQTATTTGQDTNISTSGWQTYKSESQGFSIPIPPTWKQTESGVEGRASFSTADAPEGDMPPTSPVTFANIWSEPNSENLTLQGIIDELKNSIQKWPIKEFKVESEEDITVQTEAGKKVVLSYTDLQTQLSHVSGFACTIKNGKIYKINFIASAQDAATAMATWRENSYLFDKMISAFIFL